MKIYIGIDPGKSGAIAFVPETGKPWTVKCSETDKDISGYAGPLTEANHLGNVAYRSGKKLEWEPESMTFPNAPDAEKFLRRSYREGWSLT